MSANQDDRERALADYRASVATTRRLLDEILETVRRLTFAIVRREDARAEIEKLKGEP